MKSVFKILIVSIITWEAKLVLKKYKPKVVAVTGSVGKTSTKEVIAYMLKSFYSVRYSQKSFNSEIGVPLTILNVNNGWSNPLIWLKNIVEGLLLILLPHDFPEWLVLEVGADRPGDIGNIARWIKPDIAVVTKLSKVPVHVEYFSSVQEVIEEKSQLVRSLKRNGTMVLNGDDEDIVSFKSLAENRAVLFGMHSDVDVLGENYQIEYTKDVPTGVSIDVLSGGNKEKVTINDALGLQQVYPALSAIAVGVALDLPLSKLTKALNGYIAPPGRMRVLEGVKGTVIIDDSYNSSPVAMEEAINLLKSLKSKGRKIAVLGDMLELGIYTAEEHKKAGRQVVGVVDVLFTVGIRARGIAEGALEMGFDENNVYQYEDSREAGRDLEIMIHEGDCVLVKGSQGVRMEKVVEEVIAHPEDAGKLLVRQEEVWKRK